MPFAIEIFNTNACRATARTQDFKKSWFASPSRRTNKGWVLVGGYETALEEADRAVFTSRKEAQAVALVCHWGNQRYRIAVVRQEVNSSVEDNELLVSCQEL